MEALFHWIAQYGYVAIFALLVLGIVGIPIPDETVLIFSGYLVFKGDLHIVPTVASAFFGSTCGITISYALGRSVGNYLITQYGHIVHITAQRIDRVHNWFSRVGRWGLMLGYFLPGIRHLIAFVAGTSKLRLSVFALFTYTGGLIWSGTFISIGYVLGKEWVHVSEKIHRTFLIGSGIVILVLIGYFLIQYKRKTAK